MGAEGRRTLSSYLETRQVYELANEDEMSQELRDKLFRGEKILESLLQYKYSTLSPEEIKERFSRLGEKKDG